MGKLLDLLSSELISIISEEVDDEEFAEALEVEALFGEAMALGVTGGYEVPQPTFNSLYKAMGTSAGSKAEKKGYVDVDLIGDLKQWRSSAEQELSQIIGDMLWKRDKVYIKDQRDFFKAIGTSAARLGQMIKDSILREWNSLGNIGLERDEPEGEGWHQAVKAGEKARVTIRPVKGKGASGWAVEMKPSPRTILRALDLSESWAYLAKTVLNESILNKGELTEGIAPKVLADLFSKASGVTIDPKQARVLGAAFAKGAKAVFGERMAEAEEWFDYEVTDSKSETVSGQADTSVQSMPRGASWKHWMTPDYYDVDITVDWEADLDVPTEMEGYSETLIGIPAIVEHMRPVLERLVGKEGYRASRSNLARAILGNRKVLDLLTTMMVESFKRENSNLEIEGTGRDDILYEYINENSSGDPVDLTGVNFSAGLKRVTIVPKRGGRGGPKVGKKGSWGPINPAAGPGSDIAVEVTAVYRVSAGNLSRMVELDVDSYEPEGGTHRAYGGHGVW